MTKLKIIYGPPCSGKSTYCKKHLKKNDIVYDYDMITRALTYKEVHEPADHAHSLIISFRFLIINNLLEDKLQDIENVYFISTFLTDDLKEAVKDLKPEYIKMEATEEECLKRLEKDDSRPEKKKMAEKIREWFAKYGNEEEGEKEKVNKSLDEKIKEKRQYRNLQEVVIGEENDNVFNSNCYVEGYAATFDKYKLYESEDGDVYERFERNCFENADMTDIIFQYNHEGRVYARLSNNTLKVEIDDTGLKVMADLSKSQAGRDLYEEIKNGLTTKMSWGFRVGEYEYDKETQTIIHKSIKKIFDVSAVSIPANDGTSISARSLVNGEKERLHQEKEKRDRLALLIGLQIEE